MAWLPRLVSAFEEDRGRLFAVAKAPVELVVVGAAPIAVLAAMLAHSVIPLLFGQGYRNAVPVMVVLGLCLPPTYLNIMLNQVLVAAKRPLVWTWLMAGATAVNPVLNFFLIRFAQNHYHNGAIGAALALLATEVLVLAGGFLMVGRHVLDRSSLWRFARAAAAAAAMGGVIYALRPLGFVVAAAAGGLVYVGLAALLRLASAEEVEMLRAGLHTVRAGIRRRTPGQR